MFGRRNKSVRDQWIIDRLKELPKGSELLDAGAGEQQYRKYCTHLKYTSQDFCEYDGAGNQSGLQTGKWDCLGTDIVGDICNIPRDDESFDVVLCTEVLEHLPDPKSAISELCRLIKPGGRLILTAPFCSMTHFAPHFYSTGFSQYFYEDVLPNCGMSIKELKFNGSYFEYIAQELFHLPRFGGMYSSSVLGWLGLALSAPLLGVLYIMDHFDRGSSSTLCFGLHVVADKRNEG